MKKLCSRLLLLAAALGSSASLAVSVMPAPTGQPDAATVNGAVSMARLAERRTRGRDRAPFASEAIGADLRRYFQSQNVDVTSPTGRGLVDKVADIIGGTAAKGTHGLPAQDYGVFYRQASGEEVDWIRDNSARYATVAHLDSATAAQKLIDQANRQLNGRAQGPWDAMASRFLARAGHVPYTSVSLPGIALVMFRPTYSVEGARALDVKALLSKDDQRFYAVLGIAGAPSGASAILAQRFLRDDMRQRAIAGGIVVATLSSAEPASRAAGRLAAACSAMDIVACQQVNLLHLVFDADTRMGGTLFGGPAVIASTALSGTNKVLFDRTMADYRDGFVPEVYVEVVMMTLGAR